MLATQIEVSDGTLNIINVGIEFFEQNDISVSLDQADPLVEGVDYNWSAATTIQFLNTVNTPGGLVPNGVEVIIRRTTKSDELYNIYDGGAPFSRLTLDENFEQLLLLSQEFAEGLGLDGLRNNLDMNGYKVVNVGDPTAAGDAANKGYVDSSVLHSLRIPASEDPLFDLPDAATRANKLLSFDENGLPVVLAPAGDSAAQLAIDLADTLNPAKGISLVGRGVSEADLAAAVANVPVKVNNKAALRNVANSVTADVLVLGNALPGDNGGGRYWYDASDVASADDNKFVIVDVNNKRWKLLVEVDVLQFGAKFDNVTDDTAALQAAYDSLPKGQGVLRLPAGIARYTTLNFDGNIGLRMVGAGATVRTILRCIGSGTTGGLKVRSTFDVTIEFVHFDHIAGFSGYLIEANHKPVAPTDTQGLVLNRCTFASEGYTLNTAKGLNLDKCTLITVVGCKFLGLLRPIDGQSSAGGSYCNVIRIVYCQFYSNTGYALNYLGEQWLVMGNNFQACADGAQRIAFTQANTPHQCCVFLNNSVYDALAAGTSYFQMDIGSSLSFIGNMVGGRSDLGSSTMLNATGIIKGVYARANKLSLFTNCFVPAVPGNVGWDLGGANDWTSSTAYLALPANVSTKNVDLNIPNVRLGTFNSGSGNWTIYHNDGTIEMGGVVVVPTPNVSQLVNFPIINFPSHCRDVQITIQSPATTTNKESLVGNPTATGFTVYVGGTGSSTIRWRAIGE